MLFFDFYFLHTMTCNLLPKYLFYFTIHFLFAIALFQAFSGIFLPCQESFFSAFFTPKHPHFLHTNPSKTFLFFLHRPPEHIPDRIRDKIKQRHRSRTGIHRMWIAFLLITKPVLTLDGVHVR